MGSPRHVSVVANISTVISEIMQVIYQNVALECTYSQSIHEKDKEHCARECYCIHKIHHLQLIALLATYHVTGKLVHNSRMFYCTQ